MKQAFTLIELLVVVLIIGILSAIALPQYQKAVVKAHIATIKPILASLRQAERVYYMTNGTYTHDYTKLDVDIPCTISEADVSVADCGHGWTVDLLGTTEGNVTSGTAWINANYCPTAENMIQCVGGVDRYLMLQASIETNSIVCYADSGTYSQSICYMENRI